MRQVYNYRQESQQCRENLYFDYSVSKGLSMNSVIKAAAIVAAVATLVFGSHTSLRRAHPQLPYEEINAYFDGAKWVSGSTQCDGSREVTIIKPVAKSKSIHLTSFLKSAPA